MGENKPLTDKQRRFVDEYLIDKNATRAYKAAGYKADSRPGAASNASQLLRKPNVEAEIKKRLDAIGEECQVNAERVIREIAAVAFSDIGNIIDLNTLQLKTNIPDSTRKAISSIKVRTEKTRADEDPVDIIEFKLWNKMDALDKLSKHLNLFKELDGLEAILARLGKEFGEAVRGHLADDVPA